MNILHLRASNFYGGPERQLHFHARLARDTQYKVTVGSFTEEGRVPEFIEVIAADGLSTRVFEVAGAYDAAAVRLIREYIRNEKIDILCTHDYRTHFWGWRARRGTGIRWLAFSRGFTLDNMKVRLYHYLEKVLIRRADHIAAVSAAQKKKLTRLMIPARKITVVYNAIDPGRYEDIALADLRKRFDFDAESIIVVSGGRFSREKGQADLIKAAALSLMKNERLRFVLFGDGPDLDDMQNLVRRLELDDRVKLPGFEKGLLGCLKGADMLINSSLSEGLPNIVLEGMALGLPVVATSVGGVPELLEDGYSGRLVPPADPEKLAEAIVQTALDKDRTAKMAAVARLKLERVFSFDEQMKTLAGIYDNLMMS